MQWWWQWWRWPLQPHDDYDDDDVAEENFYDTLRALSVATTTIPVEHDDYDVDQNDENAWVEVAS